MLAIEDVLSLVNTPKEKVFKLRMLQNFFIILEKEPLEGIEKLYKDSYIRELVKFTLVFERLYLCMKSEKLLANR